ncbi:VOC family protein [Yoonia sp. BS5-3]|uniref:VOC family protein n=1 Tax=Yoonia phaeophyticola TaxID=3137369 RepID=A0ABZ2V2D7_9RHOB
MMVVRRIVVDIAADNVAELRRFYEALFALKTVMDQGWIATLAAGTDGPVQISVAREGGSGTAVPDVSIEVDDVDALYAKARSRGHTIVYPLTDEPWGVRRFYLRDPAGKVLNILSHIGDSHEVDHLLSQR